MRLLNFSRRQEDAVEAALNGALQEAMAEPPLPPAAPVHRSLLEANQTNVQNILNRFEGDAEDLRASIAERQHRLAELELSIVAFTSALAIMQGGGR